MGYGYKLFAVAAKKNGRGAPVAWDDAAWANLLQSIEELRESKPVYGSPPLRDRAEGDDEPWRAPDGRVKEGTPIFKLLDPVTITPHHVHFEVSAGTHGQHNDLFEEDEIRSIGEAAAGARHRVDLWRSDGDTSAIMAIETINGFCPQAAVRSHLQYRSRERVMRKDDGADRRHRVGDYLGLAMAGHPDGDYLRDLIGRASKAEAVFKDVVHSARGRVREVNGEVRFNLKEKHRRDAAVTTVNEWVDALLTEDHAADDEREDPVTAMLDTFDVSTDALDELSLAVNDVELVLKPESGPRKIYTPHLVKQLFTYPTGSTKPSDLEYYDDVCARVNSVQHQYDRGINVVSRRVVVECLTDSAWAPSSWPSTTGSDQGPAEGETG